MEQEQDAGNGYVVDADNYIIKKYVPIESELSNIKDLRNNKLVIFGGRTYEFAGGFSTEKHNYSSNVIKKISLASEAGIEFYLKQV